MSVRSDTKNFYCQESAPQGIMKTSFRIDHIFLRLIFGRRWREKVWASKADITELQAQITASTTPFLVDFTGVKRTKLYFDTPNQVFNPTIIKFQDGYLMAARCSSSNVFNDRYTIHNPNAPYDANYLVWLDENLSIIKQEIIDETIFSQDGGVWTPPVEDIRLFCWGDEVWAMAAIFDRGVEKIEQAIFQLLGNKVVQYQVLRSPLSRKVEKNWIPVPFNNELKIIYSFEPLEIWTMESPMQKVDPKKLSSEGLSTNTHPYRGGSPLVPFAEGYLSVVHAAPLRYKGARLYTHHFILFDKHLNVVEIGRPFFIEHIGIEIVSGIVAKDDGVMISYAVGDRLSRLLQIPKHVIEKFLSCE